MRRILEGIITL